MQITFLEGWQKLMNSWTGLSKNIFQANTVPAEASDSKFVCDFDLKDSGF